MALIERGVYLVYGADAWAFSELLHVLLSGDSILENTYIFMSI